MAEITASMVKDLRERTDAPMMDCKKALTEADGDMVRAEEILRVRFGNKASKAAGRVAAEGTVGISISADGKTGAMVEVNSETDFCAKNDEFLAFTRDLATAIAAAKPADINAVADLKLRDSTVEGVRTQLVGKIGENITPRRFISLNAQGKLASYVHGSKIGVLVDLVGGDEALGKDIAMHIAAAKPRSLDASGVEPALIEAERRVAIEKAKEAGKPEAMLEKIAEGTVQKYLKEVTLLSQPFVKDDKQTVEQLLKSRGASVASFTMYVVGEGIEKVVTDFAAEVAAAAKV
ncbi:MAG TPA: translation elongation factor Ts [Methylophilaceae bacterium]|jgi:elongation factor Ts